MGSNLTTVRALKLKIDEYVSLGFDDTDMLKRLIRSSEFEKLDSNNIEKVMKTYLKEHSSYRMVQKIVRSKLLVDSKNSKRCIMFDPASKTRDSFDRTNLNLLLHPKYNKAGLQIVCRYDYNPFKPEILSMGADGFWTYNQFEPAPWQRDWFYSSGNLPIPKVDEPPEKYKKFIEFLTNSDKASYEYVMDWLSYGLKARNFCYLVIVGEQGVGKGRFGDIMAKLFGSSNFYVGSDKMFKGRFNSQIANKRLVHCDEVSLTRKEDMNRLKEVANDIIESEKKGIDAENVKNYANFYMTSNDLDAIPMTEDDRRFSVIEITGSKLRDVMSSKDINMLDKDEHALSEFARYLYHRPVEDQKMLYPFVSKRKQEVIETTLADWEKEFLTSYSDKFKGMFRPVREIKLELKELGCDRIPGHRPLKKLCTRYPNRFSYRNATKEEQGVWGACWGVYVTK